MASPAPAQSRDALPLTHQGRQERAVLEVLVANHRRVIGRRELARQAGLAELSERRCDSILVGVRRLLGGDAIITVRSRGWMLAPHAVALAIEYLANPNDEGLGAKERADDDLSHVGSWPVTQPGSGGSSVTTR
jgi:hypothetical protein